jgi:hypothetical protein
LSRKLIKHAWGVKVYPYYIGQSEKTTHQYVYIDDNYNVYDIVLISPDNLNLQVKDNGDFVLSENHPLVQIIKSLEFK